MEFSINDAINNLWEKLDGWLDAIILKLPNMVVAILVMILFYFLAKYVSRFTKKIAFKGIKQESIKQMLTKILFAVILLVGFFIALGILELDKALTSILAGAGVVGLAIGLALQGTLGNTVSGLVLSFLPKVRIGDFIESIRILVVGMDRPVPIIGRHRSAYVYIALFEVIWYERVNEIWIWFSGGSYIAKTGRVGINNAFYPAFTAFWSVFYSRSFQVLIQF